LGRRGTQGRLFPFASITWIRFNGSSASAKLSAFRLPAQKKTYAQPPHGASPILRRPVFLKLTRTLPDWGMAIAVGAGPSMITWRFLTGRKLLQLGRLQTQFRPFDWILRYDPILASATQKSWIDRQGGQNEDAIMEWDLL
jgi:hypothetical protein